MSMSNAPDSFVINAVAIKNIADIKEATRGSISKSLMIAFITPPKRRIIPTSNCRKKTILKKILKVG